MGESSQTRAMSARTLQAYGNGKGVPLTGNAEGKMTFLSFFKKYSLTEYIASLINTKSHE